MTTPEFSVLLLAWDDADPSVAVLGGAALPPTLPLVYQLAARQPVVALYPHLPTPTTVDSEEAAPLAPEPTALAPKDAFDTTKDLPGVQLLPRQPNSETTATTATFSRIIGLAELLPASHLSPTAAPDSPGNRVAPVAPALPSQWPTGANAPVSDRGWQAPAAPYQGATPGSVFPPPPPAPPRPLTLVAKVAPPTWPGVQPRRTPQAGDLGFDPDPDLPALALPAMLDEPTEEIGAAEALAISAPEDDLVPDAPTPAAVAPAAPDTSATAAIAEPPAAVAAATMEPAVATTDTLTVLVPAPQGLSFRMIEYARQAARLVRGRVDFDVLYAPNWPAWLAALEIRTSSGRPLVLYAASLASATAPATERGWVLEIERMALRRAALVLVPDAEVLQQLRARHPEVMSKIRVVPATNEAALQQLLAEVALGS